MPKKRQKDLAAKDLKPGLRFRYQGADVEILREREVAQDRFGQPLDRWWSRNLGTGQEGYVSLGPTGKLYNVEPLSAAAAAKPSKRHHATKKSPAQLDREIAEALAGAGSSGPFEEAKAELALIEKEMAAAEEGMRAFPRGTMGLPPENVRLSPEYRAAKARTDKAFARLRAFNAVYVKRFAKELRAERAKRYGSR